MSTQKDNRKNQYLGLGLVFIVLLLNEWVLGPLFANDGSIDGLKLIIIRVFDVSVLFLAFFLFFLKIPFGKFYHDTVLILFNVLILFAALNLLAYASLRDKSEGVIIGALDLLWNNPEKMIELYKLHDHPNAEDEIKGRIYSPGVSAHPSLQVIMRPTQGKYYNSDIEGTRRSCRSGKPISGDLSGGIWMFGGSTTYGTGVADCETIASHLNDLDRHNTYFNFGVESRGQNPEIDHLLFLLRKGYRPKAVIFLDGLNDITINALQTPLLPVLTIPAVTQQPYYFQLYNNDTVYFSNMLVQLPLVKLLNRYKAINANEEIDLLCQIDNTDIYQVNSEYHEAALVHLGKQNSFTQKILNLSADKVSKQLMQSCTKRIQSLYAHNNLFLQQLANTFQFNYKVYIQPLTMLMPDNPFIANPPKFEKSALKYLTGSILQHVRQNIADDKLNHFVDISQLGKSCSACMVDANHYTNEFGREIAAEIINHL